MSKERGEAGIIGDAFRVMAIAFFGIVSAFTSENTKPGKWAAEKKKKRTRK